MKQRILSIFMVLVLCLSLLPTAAFAQGEDDGHAPGTDIAVCTCETVCTDTAMNTVCPICGAENAQVTDCGLYAADPEPETLPPEPDTAVAAVQRLISALPSANALDGMNSDKLNALYEDVQAAWDAFDALTEEQQATLAAEDAKLYELLAAINGYVQPADSGSSVSYIEFRWNEKTKTLTSETKTASGCTAVTSETTSWNAGWYVVSGEVTIRSRVTVAGDVKLILVDNAHLIVNGGIAVNKNNTFTVYAQSQPVFKTDGTLDEVNTKTGKLTAQNVEKFNAAIGGEGSADSDVKGDGGKITIHGGMITAGGNYGAGIGGGWQGAGGEISIYGGVITAMGSTSGAGIGGGDWSAGGEISIYGGQIKAVGGEPDSESNSNADTIPTYAFSLVPTPKDNALCRLFAGNSLTNLTRVLEPTDTSYTGSKAVRVDADHDFLFNPDGNTTNICKICEKCNATVAHTFIPNSDDETTHLCKICTAEVNHSTPIFAADNANHTISGTCADCSKNLGTFTLTAPTGPLTYDGNAKEATVTGAIAGAATPEITYALMGENEEETALSSAPVSAGTYKAGITCGTGEDAVSVSVTYSIGKATPMSTDFAFTEPTNLTYNSEAKTATVTSSITGMGSVTVKYFKDGTEVTKVTDAGSYTVKIDVAEGDNYSAISDLTADDWTFTISKATPTAAGFTADGLTATYDGTAKTVTATLNSPMTGAGDMTVKYDGSTTAPTNVGTYTVTFDVAEGANFKATSGLSLGTLTISAATQTITPADNGRMTIIKNGADVDIATWASSNAAGAKLTYTLVGTPAGITLSGTTLKAADADTTAGSFTIKVSADAVDVNNDGTPEYNAAAEQTISVTVVDRQNAGVTIDTVGDKTYADSFTVTASVGTGVTGGTWSWTTSDDSILAITGGADSATVTVKTKKADTTGAKLTVTYTSYTHYGTATTAAIPVAKKAISITGVSATERDYDGTTTVALAGGELVGKVTGDDLSFTLGSGTAESANAGTQNVTTAITLTGEDAENYTLTQPDGITVTIRKADPTAPTGLAGLKGNALSTVTLPDGWTWDNSATIMDETKEYPASYAGSANYNAKSSVGVAVTVSDKQPQVLTVTMDGWTCGEAANDPQYTMPEGAASLTIQYKIKGTADSTYTATVPTNAGEYTVRISYETLTEIWSGSADFTIAKATPTGEPKYTAITTSGKTLADAALTTEGSTFSVAGSVKWIDADGSELAEDTKVEANKEYRWLFTPTDTDNYNTISGSIKLWSRSSGGGGGGSYTPSSYTITVEKSAHGTISVSTKSAKSDNTVTITVTPDKGYDLENLIVLDGSGKEVSLTAMGGGKYTFKMPASAVTVKAVFAAERVENPFVDVPSGAYYEDAVLWALKNGITGGIDTNHFGPDLSCTRAQLVTFLWRAAGCPALNRNW